MADEVSKGPISIGDPEHSNGSQSYAVSIDDLLRPPHTHSIPISRNPDTYITHPTLQDDIFCGEEDEPLVILGTTVLPNQHHRFKLAYQNGTLKLTDDKRTNNDR